MDQSSNFATLRESAGLTVDEVAGLVGCDVRTVYRWESGKIRPRKIVTDALTQAARERKDKVSSATAFTFVDLFSGIGGMRLGFEAVGGRCVASCEIDKYSRETYAANFAVGDDHPFFRDVRDISESAVGLKSIPQHDVLVAGFPCQPFSIAGVSKKNALGVPHGFACDAQGTLFFNIAKILKAKRPKAFLLENVKNLVSHDGGRTFRVIMDILRRQLKYRFVDYRIIDAKSFLPQHRERTIIVGFAEDVGFSWNDANIPPTSHGPRLQTILHNRAETSDGRYTVGKNAAVNGKYTLTDHLWNYLQNYAAKHRAAGNGFGFGLFGPNDVARTLSARYYKDGSEILIKQGVKKNPRRLTPRECSRLMGFDRDVSKQFKIVVSDTQAYKQFGNAVAVPVVEAVARAMLPALAEIRPDNLEPRLPLFR